MAALQGVQLVAQAKDEHGLTPRQKRFATLLATRPDEAQYKLAIEAGAPPRSATVWAARTSRLPQVKAYYERLTSAAVKSIRKERAAIADIAEVLEYQSAAMRGRIGKFIRADGSVDVSRVRRARGGAIKKYKSRTQRLGSGEDAVVLETTAEIELADPQVAAAALLNHYNRTGDGEKATVNIAVINNLPTGPRIELIKSFLSTPVE